MSCGSIEPPWLPHLDVTMKAFSTCRYGQTRRPAPTCSEVRRHQRLPQLTFWSTYPKHWGLNRFRDVCRPSSRVRVTDDDGDGSAAWWTVTEHTLQHHCILQSVFQLLSFTQNSAVFVKQPTLARRYSCCFHEKYITSLKM
jgi:hypothetical protein